MRRPRGFGRRGSRSRDAGRHRRLSRLHGGADQSVCASHAASSTSPAATNTPWRGRARASCIARPDTRRGRATPDGLRPSARSRRARAAFPTATDGSRFLGATFDPSGLYRDARGFRLDRRDRPHRRGDPRPRAGAPAAFPHASRGEPVRASSRPHASSTPIEDPRRGHFLTFETPRAEAIYAIFWPGASSPTCAATASVSASAAITARRTSTAPSTASSMARCSPRDEPPLAFRKAAAA